MLPKFSTVLFALLSVCTMAQKGTVSGTITTIEDGKIQPLPFVNVALTGTSMGGTTDLDGRFSFAAEPGAHTVMVRFVGFAPVEKAILVAPGPPTVVDLVLDAQGIDLGEVEIVQTRDREREGILLLERRTSTDLVQNIGAQELKKKGSGDVAEGVRKMVGISTVGNKYVVVRGLGDRYNAAYLNGLPLPSPDPDTKVAPLDIFPTSVVSSIRVTKAFTPELYGDFAGGAIDIRTKGASGQKSLQLSIGSGMNAQSTFRTANSYSGGKHDRWGMDDGTRSIPAGVLGQGATINGESLGFAPTFDPVLRKAMPDLSFGLFGTSVFNLGSTAKLNVLATANYSNDSRYSKGKVKVINTGNIALIDQNEESWTFNTQSSALASAALDLGQSHTIGFTSAWVNMSSDDVRHNYGEHFDYQDNVFARRYTFRQNTLWNNQLSGEHRAGRSDRLKVDWAASTSTADASEPDRRQLVYLYPPGSDRDKYRFNTIDRLENHRWYSALQEQETSARAGFTYRLIQKEAAEGIRSIWLVKAGAQLKRKQRTFGYDIFSYDLSGVNAANPGTVNVDRPDNYLNNNAYQSGVFSIRNVTGPEAQHRIEQDINAAYLSTELDVLPGKLKLMGGARLEDGNQSIIYRKQSDSYLSSHRVTRINSLELLPFAALKADLNPTSVLRVNASRTLARPGFREMAPFEYTEYFAGVKNVGNPDLQNGVIHNADMRFEKFPKTGGLLAVGVFGKVLDKPIEKVALATASGQLQSFRNTGTAKVLGIELELVRNVGGLLGKDSTFWNALDLGFNTTFMHSELTIAAPLANYDGPTTVLTNSTRPLQGASPYLINADLSYGHQLGNNVKGTFALAYNIAGRRVFAAGANGLGDQYELPVGMLNLIAQANIGDRWQVGLSLKNLLDARMRIEQESLKGTTLINEMQTGPSIAFSLGYTIL